LQPQLPRVDSQDVIGFYDLVEVLYTSDLATQGVTWQTIRKAAESARSV